jgi:hypothetical protein
MDRWMRLATLGAVFLIAGGGLNAQQKKANLRDIPEARQLDFWVGEWNLTWPKDGKGTNSIAFAFDSAVIEEHFSGENSIPLRGLSVSVYGPQRGKWLQTWVDNDGSYLDLVGSFKNGKMVMQRKATVKGKEVLQRMVWKNITHDAFDWSWERSSDGGSTWQVVWPIHYARKS